MYTPKARPLPNISSKYFSILTVSRIKSTTINVNKNGPIKDPRINLSNFFMKSYALPHKQNDFSKIIIFSSIIFFRVNIYLKNILSSNDFLECIDQALPY